MGSTPCGQFLPVAAWDNTWCQFGIAITLTVHREEEWRVTGGTVPSQTLTQISNGEDEHYHSQESSNDDYELKRHPCSWWQMAKNDSWLNWSVRPNGWSWQQDMIWHHCLWIRVKDMDIHENSSSTQILHSYWFKLLDLKKKVVSGGEGSSVVHLSVPLSWVGWFSGQHCTGLQSSVKGPKVRSVHVRFPDENDQNICTHSILPQRWNIINQYKVKFCADKEDCVETVTGSRKGSVRIKSAPWLLKTLWAQTMLASSSFYWNAL